MSKMLRLFRPIFSSLTTGPLKMALIVRGDLKMGKGKTAAQCAHASILCYEMCSQRNPNLLKLWSSSGQPKIVLRIENLADIESLYKTARNNNIVCTLVRDAGRTQLASGTITVLGLGPDTIENIDKIVKHLKLL